MEKENEFEVDWYFLQFRSQRRDRDELGDVEQQGDDDHGEHVPRHRLRLVVVSFLKIKLCFIQTECFGRVIMTCFSTFSGYFKFPSVPLNILFEITNVTKKYHTWRAVFQ